MKLQDARILVADDQHDVARTLTRPLREAGAALTFAANGTEAFEKVSRGGYDMLVVDMKMPPGEWGGLWLLEQLQQRGAALPSVVLSGEGQKQQTVEAMRRGAADWIDKGRADTELVEGCAQLWQSARDAAVGRLVATAPSPLAYPYSRYRQAIGTDGQLAAALRTLEEVVRFTVLIGMATSDASACGPLSKVKAGSFARPSFGTWVSTLSELKSSSLCSSLFRWLAEQIMPDSRQRWDNAVKLRNDIHHGSLVPSKAQIEDVLGLVITCAHRISASPPFRIGSHAEMRFDGDAFDVTLREYTGALPPVLTTTVSDEPLRSQVVYVMTDGQFFDLEPWFCILDSDSATPALGIYDVVASARGGPRNADVLVYVHTVTAKRGVQRTDRKVTWGDVAYWFDA